MSKKEKFFNIYPQGFWVSGPLNNEAEKSKKAPQSLEEALWRFRSSLLESGLAEIRQPNEESSETEQIAPLTDCAEDCSEKEFLETEVTGFWIPFTSLAQLKENFAEPGLGEAMPDLFEPTLSDWLPPLTEWTLKLEANTGALASPDLQLDISFWYQGRQIFPRRHGPWLTLHGQNSLLNGLQWKLCLIAESLNQSQKKGLEHNFSKLAELYETIGLGTPEKIQLEGILEDTVIWAPSRMSIGWQADSDQLNTTHSAYPVLLHPPLSDEEDEEQWQEAFQTEFFKTPEAQLSYSLKVTSKTGKIQKVRVLLPIMLQNAATQIRRSLRGLPKDKAQAAALSPDQYFEEVCPADILALDWTTYGPRVIGLGPLVFKPIIKVKTLDRICLLPDGWKDLNSKHSTELIVVAEDNEGNPIEFPLSSSTIEAIEEQAANGSPTVRLHDKYGQERLIPVDSNFLNEIKKVNKIYDQHLLILSNEDKLEYTENQISELNMVELIPFKAPAALATNLPDGQPLYLDEYQKEGVSWLQTAFLQEKPGVLLADDMGLGKTLQVLAFLAWMLEDGWGDWQRTQPQNKRWSENAVLSRPMVGKQYLAHPHPILVVVPKMLLDNWQSEIEKFFQQSGEIFKNFEKLDSKRIKAYIWPSNSTDKKFQTGFPSLDIERLKGNRLIVANYDTVKNHYQSFAKIPWSCLVMDESQEMKNPSTAINHTMRTIATNARFKIAMTGTPIENDMMDLWALFDIAAPGVLLTEKEFKQKYFQGANAGTTHGWNVSAIREQLRCGKKLNIAVPSSYVLGRKKADFLGDALPPLVDLFDIETGNSCLPCNVKSSLIRCQFTYTMQEWQQQEIILSNIAREAKKGSALRAVQQIKLFSEHPWLAEGDDLSRQYDIDSLLKNSSKFRWLLETLRSIRQKQEKVLIFTRSIQMQKWICDLLQERFGISFHPINGSLSSRKIAGQAMTTVELKRFEKHRGFAALVLSPEVAGVGLNITAANHVIHYGRWWNPAKEEQATCRAYRKGQQRPVYLYIPIGVQENATENKLSFDLRLHELLRMKSDMREDFLTPVEFEITVEDAETLISGFSTKSTQSPQLEGWAFEKTVADWMLHNNYENIKVTPASNDWGSDIIATKGNLFYLVQCKRQLIGNSEIIDSLRMAQSFYSSVSDYTIYSHRRKCKLIVASLLPVSETTREFFEMQNVTVWQEREWKI